MNIFSGTCAARSVLAVMKYLLKRSGMNRSNRKLISYGFRFVSAHIASRPYLNIAHASDKPPYRRTWSVSKCL